MLCSIVALKANVNNFEVGLLLGKRRKELGKLEKNHLQLRLGSGPLRHFFDGGSGGVRTSRIKLGRDAKIVPILWCRAGGQSGEVVR